MVKDVSAEYLNSVTARYRTGIRIILLLFAALLLAYVVFKVIRALKKPANADYVPGGGEIPSGWSPKQMTDQLFDVIDGTLVSTNTMDETFKKFNALSDNQIIAVYNKWLDEGYDKEKKYYLFPYGTLTNAIKDKIGYVAFGMNEKDLAIYNLERLHLN